MLCAVLCGRSVNSTLSLTSIRWASEGACQLREGEAMQQSRYP